MEGGKRYRLPWARYPGLRIAVLLAAGILFAASVSVRPGLLLIVFLALTAAGFILEAGQGRKNSNLPFSPSTVIYLFLIPVFGALIGSRQQERDARESEHARSLSLYAGEEIGIEGIVTGRYRSSSGRESVDLESVKTVFDAGRKHWNRSYLIRLYLNEPPGSLIPEPGDRIHATARLYNPARNRNPGQFDYRSFLKERGVFIQGEILDWQTLSRDKGGFGWFHFRKMVHGRIDNVFDETTAPLAKALLTGYRLDLGKEEQEHFARAGLSHIMAVSGLHVGFIAAPFWFVFPWLWQWKWGKRLGLLLFALVLFLFTGLAGFTASAGRASLMAWLLGAGKLMKRDRESLNIAGVSAVVLLLIDPSQLFDIGFQLSYSAVFLILLMLPHLRAMIPSEIRYTARGNLLMVVLISTLVQMGLYPILTWYFGEFSLVGPLANALVVPVLTIAVPFSFLLVSLDGLFPGVNSILNIPVQLAFLWTGRVAGFLGSRDESWISAGEGTIWLFLIWTAAAGLAASVRIPPLRQMYASVFLFLLCLGSAVRLTDAFHPLELKVVMLDVGQGDAIHIATPAGRNILVDTGRWSIRGNSGDRVLLPYLESHGIQKLDAVILSHPHSDHIGGMPALLQHMEIDSIYHSGYDHDSRLFENYRKMALQQNAGMKTVRMGDMIRIDPSIRVFVLGPENLQADSSPNNRSVIFKLIYNRTGFLFAGDAEQEQEERITGIYGDFLDSDFLKVGHHGSRTSSGYRFLEAVQPLKAAVSLSYTNPFSHPHSQTVKRIRHHTDRIYYTSLEGGLVFVSDGRNIRKVR